MKTKLGSLSEKLENIAAVHARDEIFCFSVWRCPMTFTFVHIIALSAYRKDGQSGKEFVAKFTVSPI